MAFFDQFDKRVILKGTILDVIKVTNIMPDKPSIGSMRNNLAYHPYLYDHIMLGYYHKSMSNIL